MDVIDPESPLSWNANTMRAGEAAMSHYTTRFDALAELQQMYRGVNGRLAYDTGVAASVVLRARSGERYDPEPRVAPRYSCCVACRMFYIAAEHNGRPL